MLELARKATTLVTSRMGYNNVHFLEGEIEAIDKIQENGKPLIEN